MTRSPRVSMALAVAMAVGAGVAHADGDAAKGEKIFAKCKACHTVEAGKNRVGPSLAGVVGRKSGMSEGFNYSAAMKDGALTWDDATLDGYLTAPKKFLPGTKMVFPGLPNEQDRLDVIAYLKSATSQ